MSTRANAKPKRCPGRGRRASSAPPYASDALNQHPPTHPPTRGTRVATALLPRSQPVAPITSSLAQSPFRLPSRPFLPPPSSLPITSVPARSRTPAFQPPRQQPRDQHHSQQQQCAHAIFAPCAQPNSHNLTPYNTRAVTLNPFSTPCRHPFYTVSTATPPDADPPTAHRRSRVP